MKVLIPSDNRDFIVELAHGYRQAGCEVVTGLFNFELGLADFDLVHYQWPEEFSGWKPPSDRRIEQIVERMKWWQARCASIVSVHNVDPHGYAGNEQFRRLYDAFYQNCTRVLHFSSTSKKIIYDLFPGARHDRHIVASLWNFAETLKKQERRGDCRAEFGFGADDFVVLIFGALRSWDEIRLLTKAFEECRVPNKRLFMTGRYFPEGSRFHRKFRDNAWRFWLWRQNAMVVDRHVPDEELYRYFDTADIVVVPRLEGLNSGIPGLAMTFGKVVIAPSHGAMPEQLAGTENPIYESGNPIGLAKAMESAALLDRRKIGEANRQRSSAWSWDGIIGECLRSSAPNGDPVETRLVLRQP